MKKNIIVALAILMGSTVGYAQSVETIMVIQDTKDGEQVVDVRYREVDKKFEIDSFAEADVNGDGCLDKKEALDKGILDFNRFTVTNKNCLNEEEYERAMRSED